jgi:hypothetical protein
MYRPEYDVKLLINSISLLSCLEFLSSVVLPCVSSIAKDLLFALSAIAITWILNKIKMQFAL